MIIPKPYNLVHFAINSPADYADFRRLYEKLYVYGNTDITDNADLHGFLATNLHELFECEIYTDFLYNRHAELVSVSYDITKNSYGLVSRVTSG